MNDAATKTICKTTKTARITIESVIESRYGITEAQADAIVVEWAAEYLATLTSKEDAGKQWRRLNARRHRMGRYTSIPAYKSTLWDAYFAK